VIVNIKRDLSTLTLDDIDGAACQGAELRGTKELGTVMHSLTWVIDYLSLFSCRLPYPYAP
jgi:Ser-tRNA(Ala) deacylase AlaX